MKKILFIIFIVLFTLMTACGGSSVDDTDTPADGGDGTTDPGTTADTTAPADVTLKVTKAGGGSVTLTWTDPSDSDFDHLIISWTPGGTTGTTVASGAGTYQVSGLTNGTACTITAKSVDKTGNASSGNSVTITPPASEVTVTSISDKTGLSSITDLTGFYILVKDVDLSGVSWTPISDYGRDSTSEFTGVFEGNNHTISNLKLGYSAYEYQSLFGYIGTTGTVQNLKLNNVDFTVSDKSGALAGRSYGTVKNCSASGAISGDGGLGGIVGQNYGTITNCYSSCTITGTDTIVCQVGGLTSFNSGTISNCYSTGPISSAGSTSHAGGLVGYNNGGTITKCYSSGSVSYNGGGSTPTTVCGFIGQYDSGTITNCFYNSGLATKTDSNASNITLIVQSNFTGWDFVGETTNGSDDIWSISSSVNNGYPYLTALPPQ